MLEYQATRSLSCAEERDGSGRLMLPLLCPDKGQSAASWSARWGNEPEGYFICSHGYLPSPRLGASDSQALNICLDGDRIEADIFQFVWSL